MAIFPTAVSTDVDLYVAVNNKTTTLSDNPLTAGATTVNVVDTTGFPTSGYISIDLEIIKYTGKTGTSFTGCTRGADGSSATSHSLGANVFHNIIADHHNALKEEIKAIEQNLSDRIGFGSTQLKAPAGTAAAPAWTFAADPDTGFYRDGANEIKVAFGGTGQWVWDGGQFKAPNGTSSLPSHSFVLEPDCGMYVSGTNEVAFVAGAGVAFYATTSGLQAINTNLRGADGTGALPFFTFTSDTNTGLYRVSEDKLGFAAGGTLIAKAELNAGVGQFLFGSGTIAAPAICIASNASHGFYRVTGQDVTGSSVPMAVPVGLSATVPGYTFEGDLDTGFYRVAANRVAIRTNSTDNIDVTDTGALIFLQDGTAAVPAIKFVNDPNTGIYAPGTADRLNITCGGSIIAQFQLNAAVAQGLFGSGTSTAPSLCIAGNAAHGFYRVTGLDITGSSVPLAPPTSTAASPAFTFATDTNTGMYSSGADIINFSIAGTQRIQIEGSETSFTYGGAQAFKVDSNGTAGNTRMLVYDVDNATIERVSVGAADSGGAGFKVLRIPN